MKFGAYIGVWNEVELIERCILHLRKIGVDQILVCDLYSTDGTAEILERFQSETFTVMKFGVETPGSVYLDKCTEAVRGMEVDWVLFIDADEFVLPVTGNIRDCSQLMNADLISLNSYNVALDSRGSGLPHDITPARYNEIDLIVQDVPDLRQRLLSDQPLPIVRLVWPPKVMVRQGQLARMVDGNHNIVPTNPDLRRATAADVIIAHLPVTTMTRFMKKLQGIEETFRHHDEYYSGDKGWHWRYLLDLKNKGELEQEFRRSVFDDAQLSAFRSEGVTKTAAEMLNGIS
jgi:glycosyltransferase involved in cell wall biosynthesis